MFKKENLYRWLLALGYLAIFLPFIYSIFYSMPANDDFAWAIEWWSSNRFVEMLRRVQWNYMNYFGQSGIMAIILQVVLNPLYLFDNVGHSFGITMIFYNAFIMLGLLVATRKLIKEIFCLDDKRILDILTFLIAVLLSTSYYYSDVYNWWSGVPGYSFTMMICMFALAFIVQWLNDGQKRTYIVMIILGILTCTSMMYCVAIGSFYVLYVFIINWKKDDVGKRLLPLILYILSGILMVVAPGNAARMESESHTSGMIEAISVTFHRTISRAFTTIQTKPWVIWLLLIVLLIGIFFGTSKRIRFINLVLGAIVIYISSFTAVLLYVYGQEKSIDSEFTPRIYFVEDYMMFIGAAILVFGLGAIVNNWIRNENNMNIARIVLFGVVALATLHIATGNRYTGIIQVDIIAHADLIEDSWEYWDEILQVVETADQGTDIVIDKENIDWCQYCYYVGLDEIPRSPLAEDAKYGNCNQCASKYYGVDSIIVNLY